MLHDAVLAPLTIVAWCVLAAGAARRGPAGAGRRWAPSCSGTVTLVAVPVLGRFGARPDNPTLLDRNYSLGWLVLAALIVVVVAVAAIVGRAGPAADGRGGG